MGFCPQEDLPGLGEQGPRSRAARSPKIGHCRGIIAEESHSPSFQEGAELQKPLLHSDHLSQIDGELLLA